MFALAFAAAFVTDYLTKSVVVRRLAPGDELGRAPVSLRHISSAGLLNSRAVVLGCWLPMIVGSALLALTRFDTSLLAQAGLGLAAGGATGNALDRYLGRPIVDFMHVRGWRVFNAADAAITCGVALALWGMV
ncbi:MAG TPA: signal peptidase II [Gaiellaceae bacterium]|nr:signal peptidase II [Gaiellaceae bacterium]